MSNAWLYKGLKIDRLGENIQPCKIFAWDLFAKPVAIESV